MQVHSKFTIQVNVVRVFLSAWDSDHINHSPEKFLTGKRGAVCQSGTAARICGMTSVTLTLLDGCQFLHRGMSRGPQPVGHSCKYFGC